MSNRYHDRRIRVEKLRVMSKTQLTVFRLIVIIGTVMTVAFGIWWFSPSHIPDNYHGILDILDLILFLLLSYVVWYQITSELFNWNVAKDMKHPKFIKPRYGRRVAFLTAFVPGKEPYEILERTLKAMAEASYPHDTWLLDEGDDPTAKKICRKYGVHHHTRKGTEKYNTLLGVFAAKTKGGNHNSWHDKNGHQYDFVAQIDVDFTPSKDFLTRTLGYFRDPSVAFVGTPQIYGNTDESWIARGAAEQSYSFYGATQKGFYGKDMQLFIGANHIIRVSTLNEIGGYSGHIVEDHLTGMKMYTKRWKSVYVPEILAVGEGPATWGAYFSQQMRWAYGLLDILFHHSPKLLPQMQLKHTLNYYFLQQHYFYGLTQVVGVILISIYFLFGLQSTSMELSTLLLLYVPLVLWQIMIGLWLQRFNIDRTKESGLLLRGRILTLAAWPIYFIAFMNVITRKRLAYAVTPKGKSQKEKLSLKLFIPHFILGTITAIDLILAYIHKDQSALLIFWAVVNTLTMYGFVGYALYQITVAHLKSRHIHPRNRLRLKM
jgi:cellulose synthase (UDP-forming)